ncbi:hypothetical protein ACQ4PT_029982 [Festuca glaucescens]
MATAAHKPLASITAADLAAAGAAADAAALHSAVRTALGASTVGGPAAAWAELSRGALRPELPFAVHRMLYYGCYAGSPSTTPPAWTPDPEEATLTNVGRVLEARGRELIGEAYKDPVTSFRDFHKFSNENPENRHIGSWSSRRWGLHSAWNHPASCATAMHTRAANGCRGAVLNAAKNCLTAKPGRNSGDVAIVWRDEGKDSEPLNFVTLEELRKKVCLVANALDTLDLPKGSAIAIDMPMNVNAVVIYLAIVLAGYIVVSIADSFAAPAISTRLKISEAKAIFTQDCILRDDKELPLYRADIYTAVEQPAYQFSNILFSSGTTGEPKAIPWTHLTPLKAAADGWCHMDIRRGDVVAWPTNLGWMMGPWLVYASLLNGASMALYNGSPNSSGFAKFVQDAKVTMLGVVPSIVRTWKNTDCTAGFDWSTIRCFSSTGEASSVDDYLWLMGRACYKPPQDSAGIGELALDPTLFGSSTTLLNADHHEVYFSGMPHGMQKHGDEFERTAEGYYRAHGRADDTMNLGGIKVSSIEIERICNRVNDTILETAAIGVPPVGGRDPSN